MLPLKSVIIVFLFISFCAGQTASLYTPSDARSISLGESFVAVNDPLSSLMYNPASYSPNSGITTSYSVRSASYSLTRLEHTYYNFAVSYHSPLGEFGVLYNRFDQGEINLTVNDPTGIGKAHRYDHTFLLKYSNRLGSNFSLGASIKLYDAVETQISGPPFPITETISMPLLIDFGAMHSFSLFSSQYSIADKLSLGISLQNLGADLRYKKGNSNNEHRITLPSYLEFGFSYSLTTKAEEQSTPTFVGILLSGQMQSQVNASSSSTIIFWGLGAEITFYELLSLRVGGKSYPYNSVYGEEDVLYIRYGAGCKLPLRYLSIQTPLLVTFDYASIPVNPPDNYFIPFLENDPLPVFSIGLEYPIPLSK